MADRSGSGWSPAHSTIVDRFLIIDTDLLVIAALSGRFGRPFLDGLGPDFRQWCFDRLAKLRVLAGTHRPDHPYDHGPKVTFEPSREPLSDPALLALIDLDLSHGWWQGRTLRWYARERAWLASPDGGSGPLSRELL